MLNNTTEITGNNNFVVQRDIIINDITIPAATISVNNASDVNMIFKALLNDIDARVNNLFPDKLIDPKMDSKLVEFSSSKTIHSLGLLGIPIDVALEVLAMIYNDFVTLSTEKTSLHTSDIRKAVSDSLYKLKVNDYDEQTLQKWGDNYIQRYGNPDQRILVLMQGGRVQNFDYDFIKKEFIPELINEILTQTKYKHFAKSIGSAEISRMAREILDIVRSLNVYRITYDATLSLIREVALQPPHPWLVQRAFDYDSVKYDYDKATCHFNYMKEHFEKNDLADCLYSIKECLHHSSSAILAYYGVYMGCGYLMPFHNLNTVVNDINKSRLDNIFDHYSKIGAIKTDLHKSVGLKITDFCSILDKIHKKLSTKFDREAISRFISVVTKLYNVTNKLLATYVQINEIRNSLDNANLKKEGFAEIVKQIISVLPGITLQAETQNCMWVIHGINDPSFQLIKPKILVIPAFNELTQHRVARYASLALQYQQSCNTCIFVTLNEINGNKRQLLKPALSKNIMSLIVPIEKLLSVATSNDPFGEIKMLVNL